MRGAGVGISWLVCAVVAAGQSPFPDPPIVAPPPLDPPAPSIIPPSLVKPAVSQMSPASPSAPAMLPPTPIETVLSPHAAVGQQHTVGVELQFGQPTGVRLQYAIFHGGEFSILAEAFGGARSQFWGDETVLGIGGRALFTLFSDGTKNALLVGPGLGVSYWETGEHHGGWYWNGFGRRWCGESDRYFINMDVNVGWLHELSPYIGWELGINFGLRVGLSGQDRHDRDISGRVNGGTIGLYTGLRF
ncbi:MAG TPA: hypothetical protein VHR66_31255 [Gemmataceae bacterium]|jgi:hypothetical protein|nr:hypothetical protein [Gemmataceae bacterium]